MRAKALSKWLLSAGLILAIMFAAACGDDNDDDDDSDNGVGVGPPDNPDPYTGPDDDDDDQLLGHNQREDQLIRRFAPVIAQQLPAVTPNYSVRADYPGRLNLQIDGESFDYQAQVDWSTRVIYATARVARLGETYHYQLYYFLFYPERPIDLTTLADQLAYPEQYFNSGPIDTKVLRVTLDREAAEPLLLEAANLSGSEYTLYVSKKVADALRDEFETNGWLYAGVTRRDGPGERYVNVLPDNIDGAVWRPTIALAHGYDEGFHRCLGAWTSYEQYFFFGEPLEVGTLYTQPRWYIYDPGLLERTDYALQPFAELYQLPPVGSEQAVGVFDRWGMIWNAYTPLDKVLFDLDLPYFTGTPGDVDQLRVIDDQYDFQDRELIGQLLILPSSLF